MKSEERHQLLTNDLGVVTTRTVGFFERHLESVIAVVCAVLVVVAVAVWWTQSAESDNTAGWTELDSAQNLLDLGRVADRFKGKTPGQWARLKIAEKAVQNALPMMFSHRELAKGELKSAVEGFESLVQDKTAPPIIRERALWGLALCLESLCDGDTSKPIAAYETLMTDFPDTIFKAVAQERIASLKKGDAKEFYEWFSKEDPKPLDVRPDEFKGIGANPPAAKVGDEFKEDVDPQNQAKPPADKSESTTPDSATPATDKPAAEKATDATKPVEGEKPSATEPPKAEEKPPENK
jgi:hypothetical protein